MRPKIQMGACGREEVLPSEAQNGSYHFMGTPGSREQNRALRKINVLARYEKSKDSGFECFLPLRPLFAFSGIQGVLIPRGERLLKSLHENCSKPVKDKSTAWNKKLIRTQLTGKSVSQNVSK
ncbi:hypothetical protein HJG60_008682 [Phyllostomus discolor]|uniref:Uncharacterized protein n=1 Tax=Phyllostomus discolor TaxID=89673 RepID=A0A833YY69_9CHIR|nr:hypothetical protein HJG60_008682 [Phyllostomus discolor]